MERVIEDILDPNRNVDAAFRATTLVLDTGEVLSGLYQREEGGRLVLVDVEGKEFRVAPDDLLQREESELSLMPDNVGELLSEQEFFDLLAYVLAK